MDEKRKKQIMYFIASVAVALVFLTSYAAFNDNSAVTTTVPQKNGTTYFAVGASNAMVVGYGPDAGVIISNSVFNANVNDYLDLLQSNGILTNVVPLNSSFSEVFFQNSSTYGAYTLQQYLTNGLGSNAIATVNTTTLVTLPKTVKMTIGTQLYAIPIPARNYTINIVPVLPVGANVPVNVHVIVLENGTLYNNQITLSYR